MSKSIELKDIDGSSFVEVIVCGDSETQWLSISTQGACGYSTCDITIDDFRKLSAFVESEFKE